MQLNRRLMRRLALYSANVLLPISVLIFALGFFPYKPLLPGLAVYNDRHPPGLTGDVPAATFDRVIFMVVDALRSDFVYGFNSGFEFTQSLIRNGSAIPFTAFAAPPTVTMPRIKALTTGSVPSFADLIFNLDESDTGSSLAGQDTWLAQIKAKGGRLIFYGDDTWLRLFPGDFFARAEGTSSFFVSDFTEVDHNVTRHVPSELVRDDWDAMIVHYLGLDHIGHKTGPLGPNMLPKQREMDGIVRNIYEAMLTQSHQERTLLILAGDHGMNAGGNHGGSGPGETEPALLFVSPKFRDHLIPRQYESPTLPKSGTEFHYYRKVQQSDLVPTLASLLRFPIPKNSLGVAMEEVVGLGLGAGARLRLLYENARQIKMIVEAKLGHEVFASQVQHATKSIQNGDKIDSDSIADKWAAIEHLLHSPLNGTGQTQAREALVDFLFTSQEFLSNVASLYNIPQMIAGIVLAGIASVLAVVSFPNITRISLASACFAVVCLLYGIMMFASSYVEEEQHFWYWLTPTWSIVLGLSAMYRAPYKTARLRFLAATMTILIVHRFAVRWNQTGQKHAGEPDIAHSFFPDNHVLMWLLVLATYLYFGFQIMWTSLADIVSKEIGASVAAALIIPAIGFKLNFTQADAPELVQNLAQQLRDWSQHVDLIRQAQVAFSLLGLITAAVIVLAFVLSWSTVIGTDRSIAIRNTLADRLHALLTMFLMMQTRASNIPLFLGCELQRQALRILLVEDAFLDTRARNAVLSPMSLALSSLLFSQVYFFGMGGSNSISSIDLSNAYNGVSSYNAFAVGSLLFSSNWTGPIWWCSAAVLTTFAKPSGRRPKKESSHARTWVRAEREKLSAEAKAASYHSSLLSASGTWFVYVAAMTIFIGTSLLAVMLTCTILRTHLFIWTVFSPKYLYTMAWCIGWHILVNIGLGSTLRQLGQTA